MPDTNEHRLAGLDKDNLRSFYTHMSNHLRATEERQTQLFLFCITASAAIISLGSLSTRGEIPSPVQWGTVAALSGVVAFLMSRQRLWKKAIWDTLDEIERFWGLPDGFRMQERLGPRMTSMGTEVAMRVFVSILCAFSAMFAFHEWWIPALYNVWQAQ